jgi:predicted ferric reductase
VAIPLTETSHVSIFGKHFEGLMRICVYVWVLDRVFRLGRILMFNPWFGSTIAEATYTADSNIVRLSVPHASSFYRPMPGTYYYLYVLNSSRLWESHPFTMASSTYRPQQGDDPRLIIDRRDERTSLLTQREESDVDGLPPIRRDANTMTFLIRPYDGFTSRIREAARSGPASLRILVEGPYGHTVPFHNYDNVLFMVGGSGIVVPLTYMAALTGPAARTRSIRIVWAARESSFAADVLRNDFRDWLDSERLSIDVYLTQEEAMAANSLSQLADWPKAVRVLRGRPDVSDEVDYAVSCADAGGLAVVACGPAIMADDARRSVVDALGKGAARVEYFEESFKW